MSQTGGIGIIRTFQTSSLPVWIGQPQVYPGGFNLVKTGLVAGQILPAGLPLVIDEAARTATPLHVGVMYANAASNATTYQVKKGHNLIAGDNFGSGATGGKAYPISSIDSASSTLYDTVTVGTTIGATTAGDLVYASTATGATSSALPAINGLLYEETEVGVTYILNSVTAVVRGMVYARRVPYSAAIAALTGLKFIIYSQSK